MIDLNALETSATRHESPCGAGTMPWREWRPTESAPRGTVALLHGGSGSWTHWVKNIEPLGQRYRVLVPDLPGLGDAASIAEPYEVVDAARPVAAGLQALAAGAVHLVGFSWGCSVAGTVSQLLAGTGAGPAQSLLLIGPAGLGPMPRGGMAPLERRDRTHSPAEARALQRRNLGRLMIHDPARIDDQAVDLQIANLARARFDSPRFAAGTALRDALAGTSMPLMVRYGEFDGPVHPHIDARARVLRTVRSDVDFGVVPQHGHWLPYEWAGFNQAALNWFDRHT